MKNVQHRPDDFRIVYHWREGSLPPPDHYEYTVSLGPGTQGEIVFLPDYPMYHPPTWKEKFDIDSPALDRLYQLMVDKGLFCKNRPETQNDAVGGSLEWMEIHAGGKQLTVPAWAQDTEGLDETYRYIRSRVPKKVWDALMLRRDEFIKDYHGDKE